MGFVRERQSDRFCDSQDSFQKLPSGGYSNTFIYKYVKELVSCNFSKIRELLQDELNRNPLYREKWNIAETNYAEKKICFLHPYLRNVTLLLLLIRSTDYLTRTSHFMGTSMARVDN
ncbi:hypothetical protein MTP99_004387 [Tenebrio molitor]|nr:hypothetical protein MTP99_004387 [Tenebrio molitor]